MAKLKKPTPADLSAMTSDNVVVRNYRNQVVVSRLIPPRPSKSKKKQKANNRFRSANEYAKYILKQPGMRELYTKGINDKKTNAHNVAVTDYLNAPKIHYIKTNEYTGAIGNKLRIKATDDFQVTEVRVEISDCKGNILEKGAAERYPRKPAIWVYTATVKNPLLEGTVIKVTAKDRPGNKVVMETKIENK